MNTQPISKAILASTAILSLTLLPSCSVFDPDYAAYKKQKTAAAATNTNPYGVPAAGTTANANPYAVPGANGETGAPYQPIPGVSSTPAPIIETPTPYTPPATTQPYTPLPQEPSAAGSTHTVEKGDTIWGLTRKYGITGDALRQANNLETDTIWVGQRLIIPAR